MFARMGYLLLLIVVVMCCHGCQTRNFVVPTPPTPESCAGNAGGLRYSFDRWPQGLAVMFVDNVNGSVNSRGKLEGSTYTEHTSVLRSQGVGYEYVLKTDDGRTAELTINGESYDLQQGKLFAVSLQGERVVIHQRDHDLSHLPVDLEACDAYVANRKGMLELLDVEE